MNGLKMQRQRRSTIVNTVVREPLPQYANSRTPTTTTTHTDTPTPHPPPPARRPRLCLAYITLLAFINTSPKDLLFFLTKLKFKK